MDDRKFPGKELEELLQEIGWKMEELIRKSAESSEDIRADIEKKIQELQSEKFILTDELLQAKDVIEKKFQDQMADLSPRIEESKRLISEGFIQLAEGLKVLFRDSKRN